MKALIIWEEVPEQTSFIVIDCDSEIHAIAREAAGYYVNAEDNDAVHKLSEMLHDVPYSDLLFSTEKRPIFGPFAEVIVCGFVM